MRIVALCPLVGAFGEVDSGEEFELDDDNAARLIRKGQAEPAPKKRAPKKGAAPPAEE